MIHQFEAIFDNGVFRPIVPVGLPDQARVEIVATETVGQTQAPVLQGSEADIVARQKKAFQELDELLAKYPDNSPDDGFSGADHDRILYGEPS